MAGPERKSRVISDAEKLIIAYHEGGHAVVQRVLPKCDPVQKVTIISRGMALGYTMALPTEDRYLQSKTEFEDKIAGLLGGNVSERMVFNDTTTGSSNDIEKATDLARRMVTEFGDERSARPAVLREARRAHLPRARDRGAAQLLGRDRQDRSTRRSARSSIKAYERATQVLEIHRDRLDALATKLIAEETVDHEAFETLFSDLPPQGRPPRPAAATSPPGGCAQRRAGARHQAQHQAQVLASAEPSLIAARDRDATAPGHRPGASIPARYHPRMSATYSPVQGAIDAAVESFLESTKEARLESYFELLRIPSISAAVGARAGRPSRGRVDRRRAAPDRASSTSTSRQTRGHPIVYADWLHAEGAPTVLVYCHYDVQPVDPLDLWDTAAVRAGRARTVASYGRGAADDKGQRPHAPQGGRGAGWRRAGACRSTCAFLFEGEEEHSVRQPRGVAGGEPGSAGRRPAVVISDTGFFEGNIPAMTTSACAA